MDLRVGKHYQLIKKIGSGAFGEIYEGNTKLQPVLTLLGRHVTTKDMVAIKLVTQYTTLTSHDFRSQSKQSFPNLNMKTNSTEFFKAEVS